MKLNAIPVLRELSAAPGPGRKPAGVFYEGDVLPMLAGLKEKYAGRVKLIYLDPPFMTGERFEMRARVGEQEWRTGRGSLALETYRDSREVGPYMNMMRRVLAACREMQAEDGMLFLHVDHPPRPGCAC